MNSGSGGGKVRTWHARAATWTPEWIAGTGVGGETGRQSEVGIRNHDDGGMGNTAGIGATGGGITGNRGTSDSGTLSRSLYHCPYHCSLNLDPTPI